MCFSITLTSIKNIEVSSFSIIFAVKQKIFNFPQNPEKYAMDFLDICIFS